VKYDDDDDDYYKILLVLLHNIITINQCDLILNILYYTP
jgi:hypothetical protein